VNRHLGNSEDGGGAPKRPLAILAICVVVLIGAIVWGWLPDREPSMESLVNAALTAGDSAQRVRAVLALGQMRADGGGAMAPYMRKVADESKDPEVMAIAILTLDNVSDPEGLPRYFAALENESPKVRERGWLAIKRNAPPLAEGFTFSPNALPATRAAVVIKLRERLESLRKQDADKGARGTRAIR